MPSMLERRLRAISKSLELSYDQWYLITKANWICTQIAISALHFDHGVTASKILLIDDDKDIVSVRTVAHRLSSAQLILLTAGFIFLLNLIYRTRQLAPSLSALSLLGIGEIALGVGILIFACSRMRGISIEAHEAANLKWCGILQTIRVDLIPVLEAELADLRTIDNLGGVERFRAGALPVERAARLYRATEVIQVPELAPLLMNRGREALPLLPAPRIARAREGAPALIIARARRHHPGVAPVAGAGVLPRSLSSEDLDESDRAPNAAPTTQPQPPTAHFPQRFHTMREAMGGGGVSAINPLHSAVAHTPSSQARGVAGEVSEWQSPVRR